MFLCSSPVHELARCVIKSARLGWARSHEHASINSPCKNNQLTRVWSRAGAPKQMDGMKGGHSAPWYLFLSGSQAHLFHPVHESCFLEIEIMLTPHRCPWAGDVYNPLLETTVWKKWKIFSTLSTFKPYQSFSAKNKPRWTWYVHLRDPNMYVQY